MELWLPPRAPKILASTTVNKVKPLMHVSAVFAWGAHVPPSGHLLLNPHQYMPHTRAGPTIPPPHMTMSPEAYRPLKDQRTVTAVVYAGMTGNDC